MNWQDYIHSEPTIMLGKPTIKGTRLTVVLILRKLIAGESVEQILVAHPRLKRIHIDAVLAFQKDNQLVIEY